MLQRLSDAPFTNQLSHLDRSIAMVATIRRLREQVRSADVAGTRQIFDEAIAAGPSDPRLHEGYAEFLEAAGLVPQATAEWQKVAALLPHHHLGTFQAGRLLSRQQKDPEAMAALDEALRLRPDLGEARIERGQIHLRAKRYVEALAEFTTVQKQRPEDPRVLVQIAHVQGAQKHVDEAMATLAEAIRLQPGYWEPHYLLGIEHARSKAFVQTADDLADGRLDLPFVVIVEPIEHVDGAFEQPFTHFALLRFDVLRCFRRGHTAGIAAAQKQTAEQCDDV